MPALDTPGFKAGASHIQDQNKFNPVKTLCGQALNKENIRYWTSPENFQQATCKVCRQSYFDEKWTGDQTPVVGTNDGALPPEELPAKRTLFANLVPPINKHGENQDGS